ncbi:MAG: cytidine deaminase [candidate division WOR-3 bacterium]
MTTHDLPARTVARLKTAARRAARYAYAPYSGFRVGAAVLTPGGEVFTGCNVENSSYGLTICAERAAICRAIASGKRRILALAVYTPANRTRMQDEAIAPCGACLQFAGEFAEDAVVILFSGSRTATVMLRDLLPCGFKLK